MRSGIPGSTAAPAVVRCALAPDPEQARSLDVASVVRRPARREGAAGCVRGGRAPRINCFVPADAAVHSNGSTRIITGASFTALSFATWARVRFIAAFGASWIIRITGTVSPA